MIYVNRGMTLHLERESWLAAVLAAVLDDCTAEEALIGGYEVRGANHAVYPFCAAELVQLARTACSDCVVSGFDRETMAYPNREVTL